MHSCQSRAARVHIAARRRGSGVAARGARRFDITEHNLRSTSVSRPLAGTIDEALACQERECFVSSGEGVSYPCIFFSRI